MGYVLYLQGKYEEAAAYLREALRLTPGFVLAHNTMGSVLYIQGKHEAAAAEYTEALRLDPGNVDAHNNLGVVLSSQGKYEAAATHFTETLRLNPGYADAHNSLGAILSRQRRYAEAEAHFAEAIRLQPGDPIAYNESAMLMAACPEAKFRDGKRAVEFATRACKLTKWKNPNFLDTLAAAQAEAGEFDAAVSTQKRAIELLSDERKKDDYHRRLVLYQARKPYREAFQLLAPTEVRP